MAGPVLTEAHLSDINAALAALDASQELITRAKQAGIDVSAQEQASIAARDKLVRIKQAFFPGR